MNAMTTDLIRLSDLEAHHCAIVRQIDVEDEDTDRLKTLGVCIGRQIEVARNGDPVVLKIFGSRLGVARRLLDRIRVEICQPGHCALRESPCR